MTRRSGLSLTEVLVALFIMAIGVIGVLTMFPVGAVQMGLALKDQRCAEAATQADGYMRWYWRHYIVEQVGGNPTEPLWKALNGGAATPPNNSSPSPPVFVDPMGWVAPWTAQSGGTQKNVAGNASIPRVTLNAVNTNALALRTCTLLDGFTYDPSGSGIPALTGGATGSIEREDRYNWLWVIQRPSNAQPFTANMSVVVFDKRAFQYVPPNAEQTGSPSGNFANTSTTVTLSAAMPVGLQRGNWIVDASQATDTAGNNFQLADFYRLVSVDSTGTKLELQIPANSPYNVASRSSPSAVNLVGVAEVFTRPPLTADAPITP